MLDFIKNGFYNSIQTESDQLRPHVYVNVYDMLQPNYITNIGYYAFGLGIFHSGVEINGKEYCFGGHAMSNVTGVFVVEPKIGIPELILKRTIDMGSMRLTDKEFEETLTAISDEFTGPSYNLLMRNCNHFTEEFVYRLTQKRTPTWINRAAKLGTMFPCVVPWEWIQPPELGEEEEEEVEPETPQSVPNSTRPSTTIQRRSSTVSLLSNRHPPYSYTEGRNPSQERLVPPVVNFQGIMLPASSETANRE
ncbi:hypothetical protein RMCBS344292_18148 [Rhizopus microsporus]|nr:hypothetical protein RMCBS344292_18148 [Rhizopus microsporus]